MTGLARGYRFDPLDRGVLFGRTRNELITIGTGALVWLISTVLRTATLASLVFLAVTVVVSLAPAGHGGVVDRGDSCVGTRFRVAS